MQDFYPISRERHAQKSWQRHSSYAFAAGESVVLLTAAELSKTSMVLPIAFVREGDGFCPAALLGLQPNVNLFISPNGQWIGNYVPAAFRSYPFRLAPAENGQQALCIDEGSGLVSDGLEGERFFGDDGLPAPAVLNMLNFLKQIEQDRLRTSVITDLLHKHKLIQPWLLTWKTDSGEKPIKGLFQIEETALNGLSGEVLFELNQVGALKFAYCQLLAKQNLPLLSQIADVHAKAVAKALMEPKPESNDTGFADVFNNGGTLCFAGLG